MKSFIDLAIRVVEGFFGSPPISAEPIIGKGSVNHVFLVRHPSGAVVVRLNGHLPAAHALDIFAKEQWCQEQASLAGVPGATVLKIGDSDGYAYMILSYVQGSSADALSMEERSGVWRTMGAYARTIHRIDLSDADRSACAYADSLFGSLSCTTPQDWRRILQDEISALTYDGDPLQDSVYPANWKHPIAARFEEMRSIRLNFGLNHGDLLLRNAIIDMANGVHLLDWGSAVVHLVPHYDLSQMIRDQVENGIPAAADMKAFLDGYGISPTEQAEIVRQSAALLLMRRLNKVRWAVQRNHPESSRFADHARAVLAHVNRLHRI